MKEPIGGAKIGETERRTVSGESCVGGGYPFVGRQRSGSVSEVRIRIGGENMASARGEVGAGCGDAGLMAVNESAAGWDGSRRDGFGIVEGGKRRGVVGRVCPQRSKQAGQPGSGSRSSSKRTERAHRASVRSKRLRFSIPRSGIARLRRAVTPMRASLTIPKRPVRDPSSRGGPSG